MKRASFSAIRHSGDLAEVRRSPQFRQVNRFLDVPRNHPLMKRFRPPHQTVRRRNLRRSWDRHTENASRAAHPRKVTRDTREPRNHCATAGVLAEDARRDLAP